MFGKKPIFFNNRQCGKCSGKGNHQNSLGCYNILRTAG